VSARGPKGWVRPDERILDELCERIVRAGVDARELEVSVKDGEVRLEGALPGREERSLVVKLAQRVVGVKAIEAEIRARDAQDEEIPETWH